MILKFHLTALCRLRRLAMPMSSAKMKSAKKKEIYKTLEQTPTTALERRRTFNVKLLLQFYANPITKSETWLEQKAILLIFQAKSIKIFWIEFVKPSLNAGSCSESVKLMIESCSEWGAWWQIHRRDSSGKYSQKSRQPCQEDSSLSSTAP